MDNKSAMEYEALKDKLRKKKVRRISAALIVVFLCVIATLTIYIGRVATQKIKLAKEVISATKILKQQTGELKTELKQTSGYIKAKDYDNALISLDKVDEYTESISNSLNSPSIKSLRKHAFIDREIAPLEELLDIVKDASPNVIRPAITQLKDNPLSDLKVDDGFNVALISSYINFANEYQPQIDEIISRFDNVNQSGRLISLVFRVGKLREYRNMVISLEDQYKDLKDYLPVFESLIGDGSDRLYILAAQNSSEIRACGGFPGSIGTIRIKDGVLTVGDFEKVYDVLPYSTPASAHVTPQENAIFGNWLSYPRDAEYCPDFERVGQIWALSYESKTKEHVDGVVSLTPSIIQEILKFCGSITLSDGTVIDGTNATQVLQHDLYSKYFNNATVSTYSNDIADSLFAETAKETMHLFTSEFDVKNVKEYFAIFTEGTKNRTILIWMSDEEEENIMKEHGCSGAINTGAPNAVAGVYYSGSDPCKLGWYFDLNTEISEPVINSDGTRTYHVKVILNNTIDKQTISSAGTYILGNYNGAMRGYVHLFAPVGGSITGFKTSNGTTINETEYNGVKLGYSLYIMIYPEKPIEITYDVTTASSVTDELTISSTPTLQSYR